MKKIEVVIKGEHEKEIGHDILSCIYAAIQSYEDTDVSVLAVRSDTIEDKEHKELQIPEFLTKYSRGGVIEPARMQERSE